MNNDFSLKWSYVVLITLTVLLSALSFQYQDEWIGGFLSNTAAGIVGSLIIIFSVEKIIDGNSKKERLRILKLALERLRKPIYSTMSLLVDIYIAASRNKPAIVPSTFEDTFTENYFVEVSFLDYRKETNHGIPVPRKVKTLDWFSYLYNTLGLIQKTIEKTIDMYAVYLDSELVEALEKVVNSGIMGTISLAWTLEEGRAPPWMDIDNDLREFVPVMLRLLELFNSYSSSPIEMEKGCFENSSLPWGSARGEGFTYRDTQQKE
jgi:hypothetical protein